MVLDGQLLLTRESSLSEEAKNIIARMDGSETICLGEELGAGCRVYYRPGLPPVKEIQELLKAITHESDRPRSELIAAWRQGIRTRVGWDKPEHNLWLLGQDAVFALSFAERFRTVGGVFEVMRRTLDANVRIARDLKPLNKSSPLARSHATLYPIVQGPMSHVSDRVSFADTVAMF